MSTSKSAGYGRSVVGQGLARLVYMAFSFAAFILVARCAGADVVGRYSLALALITIAIAAADFGMTTLVGADLARLPMSERRSYLGVLILARVATGLAAGSGLAATILWSPNAFAWPFAIGGAFMPLVAARCYDPVFQVYGKPAWTIWLSLIYGALLLGTTGAALLFAREPEAWLTGAIILAATAYGVVGLALVARLALPAFANALSGAVRLLNRAAPVGIANLAGMLNARIGVIVLSAFAVPAAVGEYNAAFRFFELGAAVAVTIATPLIPVFVARHAEGGEALRRSVVQALGTALAVSVLLAATAPAFAPFVIALLYGPGFAASAPLLGAMAWLFVLALSAMILFAAMVAVNRQGIAFAGALVALGANAGVSLLAVPHWGAAGATAGAFAAEVLSAAINFGVVTAAIGLPIEPGRILRIAASAMVVAAAIAVSPSGWSPLVAAALLAGLAVLWLRPVGPRPLATVCGSRSHG